MVASTLRAPTIPTFCLRSLSKINGVANETLRGSQRPRHDSAPASAFTTVVAPGSLSGRRFRPGNREQKCALLQCFHVMFKAAPKG